MKKEEERKIISSAPEAEREEEKERKEYRAYRKKPWWLVPVMTGPFLGVGVLVTAEAAVGFGAGVPGTMLVCSLIAALWAVWLAAEAVRWHRDDE